MKIKVPKIHWHMLGRKAKNGIPLAGAIVATVGVGTTAYFTATGTKKALAAVEAKKQDAVDQNLEYTKLDAVKDSAKYYIPAALSVAAALSGIWVGYAVSAKAQAALISAYGILQESYDEYRDKTNELYGPDADQKIREAIENAHIGADYTPTTDGELKTFYEPHYGHFFVCTEAEMVMAEMELNRQYQDKCYVTMDDFYALVNKFRKQPDETIPEVDSNIVGWDCDRMLEEYEASWIDIFHDPREINGDMEINVLVYPIEPELLSWERREWFDIQKARENQCL